MEMVDPNLTHHRSLKLWMKPQLYLLITLLPNLVSSGLITSKFSPFNFSSLKSRFDLTSRTGTQSGNNLDESNGLNDLNEPSASSISSVASPLSSSYSTNSVTYGLPNLKDYSTSSTSLDLLPGGSMVQSYPPISPLKGFPSNFGSIGQQRSSFGQSSLGNGFNYPGKSFRRSFNYPSTFGGAGGYPTSNWPMRPRSSPFSSRFRGYSPYYRDGLRRNGYKSRYGKGRKRYRKPYHYESRNYRSWYPRYRANKYNSDYDYNDDYRNPDSSIMGSASSPSETFYSLSSNSNSGSKDYLKIGGIGNNIVSYLANAILKGPGSDQSKGINSTINGNSSSDAMTYDGPFIQFGETKISLKSNDKGGITVTVGRSKM